MNKDIKKIIAITLAIGAFSVSAPTVNFNLMTTKAYAESDDGVQSIRIKASGGSGLKIYDDNDYKSNNVVDNTKIKHNGIYYVKSSSKKVKLSVDGPDEDYVRVFNNTSSSSKGQRTGESIDISDSGSIIVRVYNQNPGAVKYSDSSYISQYKFKIKYTGSDDEEQNDNVYLKNITISSGDINFAKHTYTYNVNVDEDIDELTIGASPDCNSDEYDNYKVKINGGSVDKDDKFKDTVDLNKGQNVIEIKVEDDNDNERIYTLNVTRGNTKVNTDTNPKNSESTDSNTNLNNNESTNTNTNANTNTNTNSNNNESANSKNNQWVQVNGKWQYNDVTGNPLKNNWMQNYYLQSDGNMATGWISLDGTWYYLGEDGAKKIGWQHVGGNWYYFDTQGKMFTGWMKDINEKYYYLNSDGSMAFNTIVNGYKIGADGAWIGK